MINPPGPREPSPSDRPPPAPLAPIKGARLSPIVAIVIGLAAVGAAAAAVFLLRSNHDGTVKPAIPLGWTTHQLTSDGFRLGLPPEWERVSPGDVDASLEELRRNNPDLADVIQGQLEGSLSDLVRFFAFDTRSPTLAEEFATNINVVVEPLPAGIDFARYLDANLSQLRRLETVRVTLEDDDVALPGGRAALIDSVFSLRSPGGDRAIAVRQYLFMKGSQGFIVSMTTTPDHAAAYKPLWEQIARTFAPL